MPRSATTGVYTRVSNSFSQPVFGTLIDPVDADAYFDDLDVGLNPPAIAGPLKIVSASATAFAVGLNGATNPAFQVDASTASQAAGLKVTGLATGNGADLSVIDSGSNSPFSLNAKGTGVIAIGNVSTGGVTITPAVTLGSTINKLTLTAPATAATLTILNNKTATFNNSITFTGTDATTMTFPTTNATLARTDATNTFTGHQTIEGVTSTGATGTNKFVFDTSPTLVTPVLGAATATSLTSPLVIGGTTVSSTLTLESTSGAGTTDTILFKTGSQVTAGTIDTAQKWAIGGAISSDSRLLIEDSGALNQLRVKATGKSGLVFNQAAGGDASFNLQDNNTLTFFTNNGSGGTLKLSGAGGTSVGQTASDQGTNNLYVQGGFATGIPISSASTTRTIGSAEGSSIFTAAGTVTATLPAASSFPGRWWHAKTTTAQLVNSASSNVVPLNGGAAGTAILIATIGKWAILQSDGANWIIMAAN